MERHLAGRALTLRHVFESDEDETLLTPSAVQVSVTPLGATSPVSSGPATSPTSPDVAWTYATPPLDEGPYEVTWDGGPDAQDVEYVEVVGGRIISLRRIRELEPDLEQTRFSSARLAKARRDVEDEFERITGRSFVPVTRRFRVESDGTPFWLGLFDVRGLVKAETLDGDEVDGTRVDANGVVEGLPAGSFYLTVAYGMSAVPGEVERVAAIRIRTLVTSERGGVPDRATSFQPVEGGTYTLATPGLGRWETGIPDVDAVLARYTYTIAQSILGGL